MRAKNEKESDEQALANFGLNSLRWVMSFCKKKGTIMKENGKVFYDIHLLIREGRVRRVAEDGRRRVEKSLSCFECNILITIFHSARVVAEGFCDDHPSSLIRIQVFIRNAVAKKGTAILVSDVEDHY